MILSSAILRLKACPLCQFREACAGVSHPTMARRGKLCGGQDLFCGYRAIYGVDLND